MSAPMRFLVAVLTGIAAGMVTAALSVAMHLPRVWPGAALTAVITAAGLLLAMPRAGA